MSAHTPVPWRLYGATTVIRDEGRNLVGEVVCEVEDTSAFVQDETKLQANATFIVTACNAHEELVAALLRAQTDMQRTDFPSEHARCEYVLGYVRDALTKVTS